LLERIKFNEKGSLSYLSPSKNLKEINNDILLIKKDEKTGSNYNYEENLNPYIDKIKNDAKHFNVIMALENNYRPRFKDWIKFLTSENSNN